MKQFLMSTAATLLLAPMAFAQSAPSQQGQANRSPQQTQTQQAQKQHVAQQCLDGLQSFREKMQQDGLWLSGYRTGYGWSGYGVNRYHTMSPAAPAAPVNATGTNATRTNPTGTTATGTTATGTTASGTTASGTTAAGTNVATAPWGGVNWTVPPMQQLRTLHAAALVMAGRGDQQGCDTVLSELRDVYSEYGQQLTQVAGNDGAIITYRKQQLASAKPIDQMNRAFRADNITGTDVRSPRDEYLGSVEDVIVDPDSGQINYLIVAHGGFLGMGEEYIAVPWQQLRAGPNMDVFVLNMTESALEKAPTVNLDSFSDRQTYDQRRQEVDRFWQQQQPGKAG